MNEEILRIQRMVAEGKVSAEESVELLESIGRPAGPRSEAGDETAPRKSRDRTWSGIGMAAIFVSLGMVVIALVAPGEIAPAVFTGFAVLFWAVAVMSMFYARRRRAAIALLLVPIVAMLLAGLFWFSKGRESALPPREKVSAEARIMVDPGQSGEEWDIRINPSLIRQFLEDQVLTIKSPDVLRQALDPSLTTKMKEAGLSADELGTKLEDVQRQVERVAAGAGKLLGDADRVTRLGELIRVSSGHGANVINIWLVGDDSQLAADLVNSVVDSYMLSYRLARNERLNRRLAGLRTKRQQVETRLHKTDGELKAMVGPLKDSNRALDSQAKSRVLQLQEQREGLRRELDDVDRNTTASMLASEISKNNVSVARRAEAKKH